MFNGDITDPRSFDDEILDSALAIAQSATGLLDGWAAKVTAEIQRRAEIRINRGEFGGQHDAEWYESRPIPDPADDEPHATLCEICGMFPPVAQGICGQCLDRERRRFNAEPVR